MMASNPPRGRGRPWTIVVVALVVFFLAMIALALWSEREDARVLGPEELEGVEQQDR